MSNTANQVILQRFQRHVGLLTAFNPDNFKQATRQVIRQSALRALRTILLNCPIPISVLLTVWYLCDDNGDANKFMVLLPVVCSLLRTELMLLSMIWKNDIIVETMQRIHCTTKKRKNRNLFHVNALDQLE